MNMFVLAAIAVVFIWLLIRSQSVKDVPAEHCAKAVIQLLKQNPRASAEEISEVFRVHERTRSDVAQVTRRIRSRLAQAHIRKEDQVDVMQAVRKAKTLLSD